MFVEFIILFYFSVAPKYQQNIKVELDIYEKLKGVDSRLPVLTVMGVYESQSIQKSGLLFKERGTRLDSVQDMHKVVQVLQSLHKLGYAHRDVRPANLLRVFRENKHETLIIDFGFASKINTSMRYNGTWETASDNVLLQLKNGDMVQVKAEDDLESLIKSMVLLLFNDKHYGDPIRKHLSLRQVDRSVAAVKISKQWEDIKKQPMIESIFSDLWDDAKKCSYEELKNKMVKIEEQACLFYKSTDSGEK